MKIQIPRALEPYAQGVSWQTRQRIRHALEAPARLVHDARWRFRSAEYLAHWTEERLNLDGYYWLFVLGLNNSGTTMLGDILGTHPLIRSLPGEGHWLTKVFPLSKDFGTPRTYTKRLDVFRWSEDHDPAPAVRAQYDWALYYDRRPGVLLEKSPPNMLRARWLQRNFRPARFIAITRDPYAVSEGSRRRGGCSIQDAARHWAVGHKCMLEEMEHLQRCLLVTYEALCDDPESTLQRFEAFLELGDSFDRTVISRPLRAPIAGDTKSALSNQNASSIARLSPDEIDTITQIAGPMMRRLGYERC